MIKKYGLTQVQLMEFFQNMTNIKGFLEQEDLEALSLKSTYDEYLAKYNLFDEALKPFGTSGLTEKINELDSKRDESLIGFAAHCRLFSTFPDAAKSEAAKYLLRIMDKYGKAPQRETYKAETAIINNMLQDLEESQATSGITAIGAEKWVADLKAANTEFERVYNDRTQVDAAVVVGETKAARKAMYKIYVRMIKMINALALINGEEAYKNLINNINEEVEKAQAAVKQFSGGNIFPEEEEETAE